MVLHSRDEMSQAKPTVWAHQPTKGFDEFTLYEELYSNGPPSKEGWLVEDQAWWSEPVSTFSSARAQQS